ncbi:DUF1707 SHOCT-like domain-containing protein [Pseudonocardia endophytica]|uniref:Uncharacterized protein DUF1707 n=1 Tax=Pseudonocardia endophytica TaxID=401976 RepID=A0A4R1HQU5_PSEEN|nr:DUF1707 domain-containing protein [Pseudonocardia endophytica]TCK24984.1 uncharacterized protein DUF1707 [Pseudonocardia endophytica]
MPTPRTRARDADRTAACDALDAAYADGQIDGVEHRERTATALQATTLGELHAVVEDLQVAVPPAAAPRLQPARRRRAWPVVVAAVTVPAVVVAGVAWSVADRPVANGVDRPQVEAVTPRVVGPTNVQTPEGYRAFVDAVRAELGTTVVDQATLYPDYAIVQALVPGEPRRIRMYIFRGGMDSSPTTGSTRDADDPTVDLASFDPQPMLALLAGAPQSLNVRDASMRYVIVDGGDGAGPRLAVHASNSFGESGYLQAKPDGTVTTRFPFE